MKQKKPQSKKKKSSPRPPAQPSRPGAYSRVMV